MVLPGSGEPAPEQGEPALKRIELDTLVGMAFSNLVALAIMVTTAATLNKNGTTDIQTSAQAAEALRPIAGQFAFVVFAMGIIGTFYIMTTFLGFGAATIVGKAVIAKNGGINMSAPLLARELGGDIFFAFISSIAFATISLAA